MTIITIRSSAGRLSRDQRAELATSLTDAVLLVECGQLTDAARWGFQVHFTDLPSDHIAIGGTLAADLDGIDLITVDITVMDGHWPPDGRATVIERTFTALAAALEVETVPPTWWVTFRTIDEGSWGSGGNALSLVPLLDTGLFTAKRADQVRHALRT